MGSNLHQLIDTLLNDFLTGMKHFLKPQNPDYSLTAPLHTVHEKLKKKSDISGFNYGHSKREKPSGNNITQLP
jgi:hypothetical protein